MNGAAAMLWSYWQDGRRMTTLPPDVCPRTRAEGYAIQAQVEQHSAAPLFGWKIAATSTAGQAHINVDGPLAGRLLRERVFEPDAVVPFGANHMRVAEAEFAFGMARDLEPRDRPYSVHEVLDAVATLHPAIEIPDSRFDDFTQVGAAQLIADNACAHYFVLAAPTAADWRSIDLASHPVTARLFATDGDRAGDGDSSPSSVIHGSGGNVLGDPRVALAWLANELSSLGLTLGAGQIVTTGTCIVPPRIASGDRFVADFGVLGTVTAVIGR